MKETSYNKKGIFNIGMLNVPLYGWHPIHTELSAFFLNSYYITKVKSKAISKKIIMNKAKIKKSFLNIYYQPPSFSTGR